MAGRGSLQQRQGAATLFTLLAWCVAAALTGAVLGYAAHRLLFAAGVVEGSQARLSPRRQALSLVPVETATPGGALSGPGSQSSPPGLVVGRRRPTDVPAPTPADLGVPIARIAIPAIGVNAPVVVKSLDPSGVMQAPDTPTDVAWYDFTSLPGRGSNIVLAGHVDFAGVGPAVFWDLWRLGPGDVVELHLVDGSVAIYRVVSTETVVEASAPVEQIVGPTPGEVVTLITCAGNYNPMTGRYDQRLIVRAERVPVDGSWAGNRQAGVVASM